MDITTGKPLNITRAEAFKKAFGFYPIRMAEQWHVGQTLEKFRSDRMEKKQRWADRYRLAIARRDGAEMKKVLSELHEHNRTMREKGRPYDQITAQELSAMMMSRMRPINVPPAYMAPRLREMQKQYQ